MNKVSDLSLAVAVYNAGAFPSISLIAGGSIDLYQLESTLKSFKHLTGSTNVLLSFSWEDLLNPKVIDIIIKEDFRYIEFFHRPLSDPLWNDMLVLLSYLKNNNFILVAKTLKAVTKIKYDNVILKGPDGAGRTLQDVGTLDENFEIYKNQSPETKVIPSGGISTKAQVDYYLGKGATAVGIGTLFALSEESCVSTETKLKLIKETSAVLSLQGKFNHQGIIFNKLENDDDNNTQALITGINSPVNGTMFAGKGIDNITSIRPVKEIIAELCSN